MKKFLKNTYHLAPSLFVLALTAVAILPEGNPAGVALVALLWAVWIVLLVVTLRQRREKTQAT